MRRSDHPSRPNAMICCFLSSFKTLLTITEGIPSRCNQCPERCLSLAGFQVIIHGRFWVFTEVVIWSGTSVLVEVEALKSSVTLVPAITPRENREPSGRQSDL